MNESAVKERLARRAAAGDRLAARALAMRLDAEAAGKPPPVVLDPADATMIMETLKTAAADLRSSLRTFCGNRLDGDRLDDVDSVLRSLEASSSPLNKKLVGDVRFLRATLVSILAMKKAGAK